MMDDPAPLPPNQSVLITRARRSRNVVIGVLLSALALMFYALAFVKLAHH